MANPPPSGSTPLRPLILVSVVYSPQPQYVLETSLHLPQHTPLGDALEAAVVALQAAAQHQQPHSLAPQSPMLSLAYLRSLPSGIWGRLANAEHLLQDGDRLEFYRPLKVDPKIARRERFAKQGARSAGLFSQRRPGAKSGY